MMPSVREGKIREALRLAREATVVAEKARRTKHSIDGTGLYANKFHATQIGIATLVQELPGIMANGIPDADREAFLSGLKTVAAVATPVRDRAKHLRTLQMLAESAIIPLLARAEHPDEPLTNSVLPSSVTDGTRGYISSVTLQANGCYERGWHDAASVMIRKLIELLIIELYEAKGRATAIKNAGGDFLMLGDLVDRVLNEASWNLARDTKGVLPKIKALGDRSAHNRRYLAKKQDVDAVIPGLRVAVDDLLHLSGLK